MNDNAFLITQLINKIVIVQLVDLANSKSAKDVGGNVLSRDSCELVIMDNIFILHCPFIYLQTSRGFGEKTHEKA